ncbi:MAG TPA: AGE family epimerase/isomerase [Chitinophagaceae bacterium]|jgi:mannobiose 2-epimerase|nr:AGE family epimerase/isomerase [Chitinophagaceae bacterium]
MTEKLAEYKKELEMELREILSWWIQKTIDEDHGGFVGKIDHENTTCREAAKGSVLNSRILWAFSSAYNLTKDREYREVAERAFHYIAEHFIDKEFGGVYWSVDFKGKPLDTKKQIYALAFCVYGLSEYYRASNNENAKKIAVYIYNDILTHSYDEKFGGYIEALTREWKQAADLRLSEKDANEKKSMNTHLHLLEAFASLYGIWKDRSLEQRIVEIIRIFLDHIVDSKTGHLILFFDEAWKPKSNIISYGHDIEAAWLIQEAAALIGDDFLLDEVKTRSVQIAQAAAKGLDGDGGLWYEYDVSQQQLTREKHSWSQAETMIGFFSTWQVTGDEKFLKRSLQSWEFVKEYMLDRTLGEWYWGVNADHSPMKEREKVGMWKCPYHNSRACIEIIQRIENIFKEKK